MVQVIDNFLENDWLSEIQHDVYWTTPKRFLWNRVKDDAVHIFEKLCSKVWGDFFDGELPADPGGWEYWTHILSYDVGRSINFHFDTDDLGVEPLSRDEEIRRIESGQNKCPKRGFVFYAHEEKPEGGYLEIKRDDGEVDRIEPIPNRLVIFDPSKEHRVTTVISGVRKSVVSNLWDSIPRHILYWSHKQ